MLFERTYGGSKSDAGHRIIEAPGDYYYIIAGATSSDGDISYDPYAYNDYWIIKINSLGEIVWERILGGEGFDQVYTGTATADGGVIAYGWIGAGGGDISEYYGTFDIWMVKLNTDGAIEWDYTIGTENLDYGQAIIQTSDGGYLAGGACIIGDGGNIGCEPFNEWAEAVVIKLDSNRNIEWQQCYGGSDHDGVIGFHELDNGYIVLAYGCSDDGDLTDSGWHGECDIWVLRTDINGNIIWQKCYGGTNVEFAMAIFQDIDDNFKLFGITKSKDGDVIGNHSTSEHDNDIWILKIDPDNGDLLSQQCIGGKRNETLQSGIIKKSDFNYVIAGTTDQGPSFDVQCTPHSFIVPDVWVFEIKDTITNRVTEFSSNRKVNIYPNPAHEYVICELDPAISPQTMVCHGEISIFSTMGVKMATKIIETPKTIWDIRFLPPGAYSYRLQLSSMIFKGQLIIQ
ncbi:MAG: T9SS type A sorting domain-containing protein [Bacteroidales bacterium]|nr:T9SS type A sorting domain-containing protein [Bacteroidales bacterium]